MLEIFIKLSRYIPFYQHKKIKLQTSHNQIAEADYISIETFVPLHLQLDSIANSSVRLSNWTNSIKTSQYNIWNFLPLNLLSQLILPYNIYFLFISLLQIIPLTTDSNGIPTTLNSLFIVFLVTAIKDALEDIKRHRADRAENLSKTLVFKNGKLKKDNWKNILPGDIIKLGVNETVPADSILLNSSDRSRCAFVETSNLDGESNLKKKSSLASLRKSLEKLKSTGHLNLQIFVEPPTPNLYQFEGHVYELDNPAINKRTDGKFPRLNKPDLSLPHEHITNDQFLLRGAIVKNTEWVYALVIYTGHNSKIFQNIKTRSLKYSVIQRNFSKHTIVLFLIQFILCIVATMVGTLNEIFFQNDDWYLALQNYDTVNKMIRVTVLNFSRFFLLLSYLIPLTLIIQLYLSRLGQSFKLVLDKSLRHSTTGKSMLAVNTQTTLEELGAVSHIFSDKTGTLTDNQMKFRSLYVNQTIFGPDNEQGEKDYACSKFVDFDYISFHEDAKQFNSQEKDMASKLILNLALCNTLFRTSTYNGGDFDGYFDENDSLIATASQPDASLSSLSNTKMDAESLANLGRGRCEFSSTCQSELDNFDSCSPDELALVHAAKYLGLQYMDHHEDFGSRILIQNKLWEDALLSNSDKEVFAKMSPCRQDNEFPAVYFKTLKTLDFDNIRKCMTVIVADRSGNKLALCKGADSTLFSKAHPGQEDKIDKMKEQLKLVANEGLRTLVFGHRYISDSEYHELCDLLDSRGSMEFRQKQTELAYDSLERDMILSGFTGIEDQLQQGVKETIENLKNAGLSLWILTGDKMETAISVAYSSNVLNSEAYNAVIDGTTLEKVKNQLTDHLTYVVAANLAGDEFYQSYLHRLSSITTNTDNIRPGCLPNKRNRKFPKSLHPSMTFDEFRRLIGFKAKNTSLINPVTHSSWKLTSEETNLIINAYLRSFIVFKNKKEMEETKIIFPNHSNTPRVNSEALKVVEGYQTCAMTVTGDALILIFSDEQCKRYFYGLSKICSSIIASRVSPKQKSEVIAVCKALDQDMISLAIGDGANDVPMLISANVGVAVTGKEGYQAARAADIVINRFSHLQNLLFCHGRENLRRNSLHVYYTIWKNMIYGLLDFFFGFYSAFSAIDILQAFFKAGFNVIYSSLPIVWYCLSDFQLPYKTLLNSPALFPRATKEGYKIYTGQRIFLRWSLFGIWCSFVAALGTLFLVNATGLSHLSYLHIYGYMVNFSVIIMNLMAIIPYIHIWNLSIIFSIILGFVMWYLTAYGCELAGKSACYELEYVLKTTNTSIPFYLIIFIVVCISLFPQFGMWMYKVGLKPTTYMQIKELESSPENRGKTIYYKRVQEDLKLIVPKPSVNS